MNYIISPNLPDRKVKGVISNTKLNNIDVILPMNIPELLLPERMHADMQIVHLYDNVFICPHYCADYYRTYLKDAVIIEGYTNLNEKYPDNVAYNVCILGNKIICNIKTADSKLLYLARQKYDIINVNQGYSKCSVCIVNDNAVITSDKGIALSLIKENIDVLLISEGHIALPGFNYGFIGGCSGKLAPDILYFNGDLSKHPDYIKITEFTKKHNCQCVFDSSFELTDIGSILPVY